MGSVNSTTVKNSIDNKNKVVNEDGTESLPNNALGHYVTISEDKKSIVPFGKIFTYRKNKRWMHEGDDLWGTGAIHLGKADEYRDPDF